MEKIGTVELLKYWESKYEERFNCHYKPTNFPLQIILFKRLAYKHDKYVLLEATDRFFKDIQPQYANVSFFCADKVFNSKFEDLIKCSPVIKYRRLLPFYPEEYKEKVKNLIQEYNDYCSFEIIPDSEKGRKEKIIEELESIDAESKRN